MEKGNVRLVMAALRDHRSVRCDLGPWGCGRADDTVTKAFSFARQVVIGVLAAGLNMSHGPLIAPPDRD
jgi:hypothetical protein